MAETGAKEKWFFVEVTKKANGRPLGDDSKARLRTESRRNGKGLASSTLQS
jgi:hypothetical protein